MVNLYPIPYNFIAPAFNLTLEELFCGYKRGIIGWRQIVDYSNDKLSSGDESDVIIELSMITKSDVFRVSEILANELTGFDCNVELVTKKWLFIVLLWIYSNQDKFQDPLGIVEAIYADFNYPEEIEEFVRYMPAKFNFTPSKTDIKSNEERLFLKWKLFLDHGCDIYGLNGGKPPLI